MNTNKKLYKMKSTLHLYNNGHSYESTFGKGGLGYHPMRMRGDGLVGTDDITGGYYYEAPELGIQRTLLEDMDLDEVERILELDKFDVDNYNSMGPVDINKMARRWTYLKYHYDPSMDWGNDDEEDGDNDIDLFIDEPIVAPYAPMPKSNKLSDKQLIENAQYEMGTKREEEKETKKNKKETLLKKFHLEDIDRVMKSIPNEVKHKTLKSLSESQKQSKLIIEQEYDKLADVIDDVLKDITKSKHRYEMDDIISGLTKNDNSLLKSIMGLSTKKEKYNAIKEDYSIESLTQQEVDILFKHLESIYKIVENIEHHKSEISKNVIKERTFINPETEVLRDIFGHIKKHSLGEKQTKEDSKIENILKDEIVEINSSSNKSIMKDLSSVVADIRKEIGKGSGVAFEHLMDSPKPGNQLQLRNKILTFLGIPTNAIIENNNVKHGSMFLLDLKATDPLTGEILDFPEAKYYQALKSGYEGITMKDEIREYEANYKEEKNKMIAELKDAIDLDDTIEANRLKEILYNFRDYFDSFLNTNGFKYTINKISGEEGQFVPIYNKSKKLTAIDKYESSGRRESRLEESSGTKSSGLFIANDAIVKYIPTDDPKFKLSMTQEWRHTKATGKAPAQYHTRQKPIKGGYYGTLGYPIINESGKDCFILPPWKTKIL